MTSGLIDRASPRFRPRPDPKEDLETAAQRGQRLRPILDEREHAAASAQPERA
jgi:hypothetical protein